MIWLHPRPVGIGSVFRWAAAAGILMAAVVLVASCAADGGARRLEALPVEDLHPDCIPDGHYPGAFSHAGLTYEVTVIVLDHRIEDVVVTKMPANRHVGEVAEVIRRVVEAQTPDVAPVGEDTLTGKALLKAIENALLDAGACQ